MSELPFTGTTQRQRMPHAEIPGCALVQDLIPLYLDGEVTPESHVLMADHLQQCERCSGYLAGARSMRREIMHEQQAVKAATAGQTVSEVRQPMANSLGTVLWRILMALTWIGGLFLGAMGALHTEVPLIMVGGAAVVFGIFGLRAVHATRSELWRALMVSTGLLGAALAPLTALGALSGRPALMLGGLALIGLAGWGLSQRTRSGATTRLSATPRYGALRALVVAGLLLGCGLISGLLVMLGVVSVLMGRSGGWDPTAGVIMLGVGGTGFLLLTLPFGGPDRLIRSRRFQQLSGILLLGGGATLSALLLLQGLSGSDTLLSVLVLVGALMCATGGFQLLRTSAR